MVLQQDKITQLVNFREVHECVLICFLKLRTQFYKIMCKMLLQIVYYKYCIIIQIYDVAWKIFQIPFPVATTFTC